MCRAGGRRCPNAGGRSTQNTRQAVSRARRALREAKATGDPAAVDTARQRLADARTAHQHAKDNAMNHQDHGQDRQAAPTSSADHDGDVTPTTAPDATGPTPARNDPQDPQDPQDPRLTPEQRTAVMRFGWSRAVTDSRRMERELADLGLFDTGTGWFTDQGHALFKRMSSGDWVTDLTTPTADQETDTDTAHHHEHRDHHTTAGHAGDVTPPTATEDTTNRPSTQDTSTHRHGGLVIRNTNSVSGNARVGSQHDVYYGSSRPASRTRPTAGEDRDVTDHDHDDTTADDRRGTRNTASGNDHVDQQVGFTLADLRRLRRR